MRLDLIGALRQFCICLMIFLHSVGVTPAIALLEAVEAVVTNGYFMSGTLRPDLIESASELASGKADTIKTHHNDTHLVRQLRQQVLIYSWLTAD